MASFVVKKTGGGSTVKGGDVLKAGGGGDQTVDFDDASDGLASAESFGSLAVRNSQRLYRMRVLSTNLDGPGIMTIRCVQDVSRVYNDIAGRTGIGQSATGHAPDTIPLVGITDIFLLDIHLFDDPDDSLGFYYVGYPVNGDEDLWDGALFFKSIDGGGTYVQHGDAIETASVAGFSMSVLADPGSNRSEEWDRTNTVTVRLESGTLSSATILNTLNGSNLAILGNELIGFTDAELSATEDEYTLSGLLRGRFGTEQLQSAHAVGERFVVLTTAGARRTDEGVSELNLLRSYKAVSVAGVLEEGHVEELTNTGNGAKPYAVGHLAATRDGSDNIDLTWTRRSRFKNGWTLSNDSALSDSPETYAIEVYDSTFTTLHRTLAATTEAVQYTIADQTTDFGAAQDPVGFKVFQVHADIGRGYPQQAAL